MWLLESVIIVPHCLYSVNDNFICNVSCVDVCVCVFGLTLATPQFPREVCHLGGVHGGIHPVFTFSQASRVRKPIQGV